MPYINDRLQDHETSERNPDRDRAITVLHAGYYAGIALNRPTSSTESVVTKAVVELPTENEQAEVNSQATSSQVSVKEAPQVLTPEAQSTSTAALAAARQSVANVFPGDK